MSLNRAESPVREEEPKRKWLLRCQDSRGHV